MYIIDEFSGDCALGLAAIYRRNREVPKALLVCYGTATLPNALQNTRAFYRLIDSPVTQLFQGAHNPSCAPSFLLEVPRFYGLDGKVGVDFDGLSRGTGIDKQISGVATDFFQFLSSNSDCREPVVLCVLGPWTDVALQLARENNGQCPPSLEKIDAVVTVAGAFDLNSAGRSVGNEGPQHQAEYNVYVDANAFVEGVRYFNQANVPVFDLSWALSGRWRLWRGLIESLEPIDDTDGLAWAAILLASGFYAFHGGNVITERGGVQRVAWLTADAHALLFSEILSNAIRRGPWRDIMEFESEVTGSIFRASDTEFVVVLDERFPQHYARTIRTVDMPSSLPIGSECSEPILLRGVSLLGNPQEVLLRFVESIGIDVDDKIWRRVNEQLSETPSTNHPA